MRAHIIDHSDQATVIGAAVIMAALNVGAYLYGVLERGDELDLPLLVVVALVGLFMGWFMAALLGRRRPDRGEDSDGGWRGFYSRD